MPHENNFDININSDQESLADRSSEASEKTKGLFKGFKKLFRRAPKNPDFEDTREEDALIDQRLNRVEDVFIEEETEHIPALLTDQSPDSEPIDHLAPNDFKGAEPFSFHEPDQDEPIVFEDQDLKEASHSSAMHPELLEFSDLQGDHELALNEPMMMDQDAGIGDIDGEIKDLKVEEEAFDTESLWTTPDSSEEVHVETSQEIDHKPSGFVLPEEFKSWEELIDEVKNAEQETEEISEEPASPLEDELIGDDSQDASKSSSLDNLFKRAFTTKEKNPENETDGDETLEIPDWILDESALLEEPSSEEGLFSFRKTGTADFSAGEIEDERRSEDLFGFNTIDLREAETENELEEAALFRVLGDFDEETDQMGFIENIEPGAQGRVSPFDLSENDPSSVETAPLDPDRLDRMTADLRAEMEDSFEDYSTRQTAPLDPNRLDSDMLLFQPLPTEVFAFDSDEIEGELRSVIGTDDFDDSREFKPESNVENNVLTNDPYRAVYPETIRRSEIQEIDLEEKFKEFESLRSDIRERSHEQAVSPENEPEQVMIAIEQDTYESIEKQKRFFDWVKQLTLTQKIFGSTAIIMLLIVFGFLVSNLNTGTRPVEPTPTTVYTDLTIFPLGLKLPGGWEFRIQPGTVQEDGQWTPQGPEWLNNSEVRRIIALPWNVQSQAVIQTLESDMEIELLMSNNQKLIYKVESVQRMDRDDTDILHGNTAALVLILYGEDNPDRWVVISKP
jgi:hypothetical protein